jgi:hypothetical protein
MNKLVEQVMQPLIKIVQSKYPSLVYVKYGALQSAPNCPSQYSCHQDKFHSNYEYFYLNLPPEQRPVSVILALDNFKLMYLPHLKLTQSEIRTITIPPGHGVIFTNACLHSGGVNDSESTMYCLFAYMASDRSHIPHNRVYRFKWLGKGMDTMIEYSHD